jgi:hypothetical protein
MSAAASEHCHRGIQNGTVACLKHLRTLDTHGRCPATGQPVEFAVQPVDPARILKPGTFSYVFEVDDCPPEDALMVEIPMHLFAGYIDQLSDLVENELGRTLVVIVLPDEAKR